MVSLSSLSSSAMSVFSSRLGSRRPRALLSTVLWPRHCPLESQVGRGNPADDGTELALLMFLEMRIVGIISLT